MNVKQILLQICLLGAVFLPAEVQAQFLFTTNNGAITITGYTGSGGALLIPSTTNGYPVSSIGNSAFSNSISVTSVMIPYSVTAIGTNAFFICTSLTNVMIGDQVTRIGPAAFQSCSNLISIYFSGNTPYLGDSSVFTNDNHATIYYLVETAGWSSTFGGLPSLPWNQFIYTTNNDTISITGYIGFGFATTIPTTLNGLSVTSIGTNAFASSSLTCVTVPNSVTNIGDYAFYNCSNLTTVVITNSVTNIGDGAFQNCAHLTGVFFQDNAPGLGSNVFSGDTATVYYLPGTTGFGSTLGELPTAEWNYIFSVDTDGRITITRYEGPGGALTIPSTFNGLRVTGIADRVFSGFLGLTSITIPNSVTTIGFDEFYACTSLTSVTFGTNLTTSGSSAFGFCSGLTNVTLPESLTAIPEGMFYKCTGLTSVTIPNSIATIGEAAFDGCLDLTSVIIGTNVTFIEDLAFSFCTSLTSITIPNSVIGLWANSFSDCSGLTSIYFQGNAPSVDNSVFYYDNATAYYLPGTLGWNIFNAYSDLNPAVLWNPQVQTLGVATNKFGFNIIGSSNLVIVVEGCSNLANPVWSPLSTNTLNTFIGTNGTSYFSDSQWMSYLGRYYRLRSP